MKQSRMLAWVVVAVLLAGYALPIHAQTPESWEPVHDLEQAALTVARDRAGQLWAVWEADDGTAAELLFSRRAGGAWSTPRPLFDRPDSWDRSPSLAVASDGTVWVAWSSSPHDAPGDAALYVSRWAGSEWSRPARVPAGNVVAAKEPALAAGTGSTLWLAWVGFDGVDDEIWASAWDGEAWSSPGQVNLDDDDRSLYDRQPRLAVGSDGNPWLVWTAHEDGVDDEIMFSRWTGTRWTREQRISSDDDRLDVWPALALDGEGRPWVAWHGGVVDGEPGAHRIFVSRWLPARGEWAEEEVASLPTTAAVSEARPSLVVDRAGGMHVAWIVQGPASTAVAHTVYSAGGWSEPVVMEGAASPMAVHAVAGSTGAPLFLWLDDDAGAARPVQSAAVAEGAEPLDEWITAQVPEETTLVPPIGNRFLAFGDSITWGEYPTDDPFQAPFYPYPSVLEDTFDTRVVPVEMVNVGEPGEQLRNGKDRIGEEVITYTPQYLLLMEGTNDVSHNALPSEVHEYMLLAIDTARHAGVENLKVMVGTLVPRLDDKNDETEDMNLEAIIPAASEKNVPLCNTWNAFYDYIDAHGLLMRDIYYDEKHPDQEGLNLLAATYYNCLRTAYTWLVEETTPPTTWIESLPPAIGCEADIPVSWTGTDNLSWVTDYDVQVSLNGGVWTDWLTRVAVTNAIYPAQPHGTVAGFQVRGRDVVGNVSAWSAPAYTTVSGGGALTAWVNAMPATQPVPFTVSWGGSGSCGPVTAYDVQYRIGDGAWVDWKYRTTDTSAVFAPADPQYGQMHFFRAWAVDGMGNVSAASPEVQTLLARYTVTGWTYNVRHEPVANPQVSVVPAPALLRRIAGGGFAAYLADTAVLDVQVSRAGLYGPLPAMEDLAVNGDVKGLTFVLPSHDDAVVGGGFEEATLDSWQLGGSTLPALTTNAHTGLGAAKLVDTGAAPTLSQVIAPSPALSDPTLSFMVRLESAGTAGSLELRLANSTTLSQPVTYTLPVASAAWTHAWYDVSGLVSEPLTLTLRAVGSPAILVDEVSLGSALPGGYLLYLPLVARGR